MTVGVTGKAGIIWKLNKYHIISPLDIIWKCQSLEIQE